jgi:hypothetical protein
MPPEWNTRSIVELPELFVCGLLHRLGASGLARLGRIQPRHAREQQLVVPWREARPPGAAKRVDLGLRRRGQEHAERERGGQAVR